MNGIAESWGRYIFNFTGTNKQFFLVGVAIYTYSFGGEIWMGPILVTLRGVGFPGGSDSKESACNVGDLGLTPGLGRSPGEGHGNPLQHSCLESAHGYRSLAGCKQSVTTKCSAAHHSTGCEAECHHGVLTCTCLAFSHFLPEAHNLPCL